MPQDKLEQVLFNRPVTVTGEVKYPQPGDPGVVDDKFMRGLGTFLGITDQRPGDLPSAIGGALGAVSLINPKLARMNGRMLINELKSVGHFPEHIVEALEFAQKRWPRLFGHVVNIDKLNDYKAPYSGGIPAAASSENVGPEAMNAWRRATSKNSQFQPMSKSTGEFSRLGFDPNYVKDYPSATNIVGHELLHAADSITMPDAQQMYNFANKLPGGYLANSQEMRARLQGAKTEMYAKGVPRRAFEASTGANTLKTDITPVLDSRISSMAPKDPVPKPVQKPAETLDEKIHRLIMERLYRKNQGKPDPRVPDPRKDKK